MSPIKFLRNLSQISANRIGRRGLQTSAQRSKGEIHEIQDYGFAPKYKGEIVRESGIPKRPVNSVLLVYLCTGVVFYNYIKHELNLQREEDSYRRKVQFERREKIEGRGLPEPSFTGQV